MSFGIFVMLVIIIVELIAVVYMFRVGLRHDAHNEVAAVESSSAMQRLSDRGFDVVKDPVNTPAPLKSVPEEERAESASVSEDDETEKPKAEGETVESESNDESTNETDDDGSEDE